MKTTTWALIKKFASDKAVSIQHVDLITYYWVKVTNDLFELETIIIKSNPANKIQVDFETNYK